MSNLLSSLKIGTKESLLILLPFTQVRFECVAVFAVFDDGVDGITVFLECGHNVFDFYVVEHDVANGVLFWCQIQQTHRALRALSNDEYVVDVDLKMSADGCRDVVNTQSTNRFGNIACIINMLKDVVKG